MKKLLAIVLVLAVLLAMATVFVGCNSTIGYSENDNSGKNEYKATTFDDAVQMTIDVYYNGDASYLYSCVPEEVWDYVEDETNYAYEDLKEYYNDYYESVLNYAENSVGKNFRVDVEIINSEDMSESRLESVYNALKEKYQLRSSKFTQGKIVEVVLTMYGDDGEENLGQKTLNTICYDGVWYVCNYSAYNDKVNVEFPGSFIAHHLWEFAQEDDA